MVKFLLVMAIIGSHETSLTQLPGFETQDLCNSAGAYWVLFSKELQMERGRLAGTASFTCVRYQLQEKQ